MKLITALLILVMSSAFAAQGKIEFVAKGRPAFITISGEAPLKDVSVVNENGTLKGQLTVEIKSLTTGIELRDEHLKDKYLEEKKYPTARFTLEGVVATASTFKGKLLLHGVEKEVSGKTKITTAAGKTTVKAEFMINLKDFQIDIPSYQGITVAEHVAISVDLTL